MTQKRNILSFIVIGSKKAFHKACENLNINKKLKYIKEFIDYDENIEFFSKPSIRWFYIIQINLPAAELYKNKMVKAIVTVQYQKSHCI